MRSILKKYKAFSASRKDTEDKQALIRVIIIFTVLVYSLIHYAQGKLELGTLIFVVCTFIFAIGIFIHILKYPAVNELRRYIGIVNDPAVTTWFLHLAADKAALYLFVYTWVAIGNGFRYGPKYLYVSATLGSLGFSSLLLYDSYWTVHWYFGLGVLITIIAVTGYTGALLTQLKKAKAKLEEMATHDHLTGLANRALLMERMGYSLSLNQRHNRAVGVVYFDLDGFKKVNDQYGHKIGDDLLVEVAKQVRSCIRHTDTFARIGGDEFVIVFDSLHGFDDLKLICERILNLIKSIDQIQNHKIQISSSLGVVHLPNPIVLDGLTADMLIKSADELMYKAKKSGKGRIEYLVVSANQKTMH